MKNSSKIAVAVLIVFVCLILVSSLGANSSLAAPPTAQTMPGRLLEMRLIDDPRPIRIPAPPSFDPKRRAPNAAPIVVNYVSTGQWGDTCTTWPDGAKTAFEYAVSLASTQFNSSVTSTIDACWVTNFPPGNILGHGGPMNFWRDFTGAPVANTWYAEALANALHGSDLDAGHEIYIGYNANRPDWYYGTDGIPESNIDLVSVAFHEIFHGLGFIPSFSYSSDTGSWGGGTSWPLTYDRFVYNSSWQLITAYTNPSTALGSQLVGNNLFFRGSNATAANGGIYPKLYAPITWSDGSSISHLDQATFSATELMVPAIATGQSKHSPGPVSLGVMKDIGWTQASPNPVPTITNLNPSSASAGGSTFTLTVNGTNYVSSSVVRWNGSNRTTSYVSSTQLTASIPASDITTAGSASVTVFNPTPGGGTSNVANFIVRSNAPQAIYFPFIVLSPSVDYNGDDDGDGLRNGWELYGYDADGDGVIDVNLPALGANYRHKDIFVEMDWMVNGSYDYGPTTTEMNRIVAAFANAPVSNPDGTTGINIHLDKSNQVPFQTNIDLTSSWAPFDAIKNANFDSKRTAVYHYMIWAHRYNGGTSSGISRGIPAANFLVTLGGWSTPGGTSDQRVGTFIHELGHNLGLTHGGGPSDHVNYKPNYLSIMNYFWQTSGLYYNGSWGLFDYQKFTLPALNEASMNETIGINGGSPANGYGTAHYCGSTAYLVTNANSPIDWNCDGDTTDTTASYDTNRDGYINTLGATQNNWANIIFNGGGIIGSGLSSPQLVKRLPMTIDQWDPCLTWEEQLHIDQQIKTAKPK